MTLFALLTACPGDVDTGRDVDPASCAVWDGDSSGSLSDDCYRLSGDVRVSNAIVIDAGTVIYADANASLLIESSGSLTVNGTQDEPVRFEGVSPGAGTWRGIALSNSPSGNNTLSWLQIDGAGGSNWNGADGSGGALFADGGSRLAADNLMISSSASVGVNLWEEEVDATIDTLTITDTAQAMTIRARHVDGFSGEFALDGEDATVHIRRASLTDDANMPALTYTLDEGLDVSAHLNIAPGATLRFAANTFVDVDGGSIRAQGTSDDHIVFRGIEAVDGYWRGVRLQNSPSANNVWTYVDLLSAGGANWTGADDSDGALVLTGQTNQLTVADSRIAQSASAAVLIDMDAVGENILFERVAFDDNAEPVKTSAAGVSALGDGLTFSGNDDSDIRVRSLFLEEDAIWTKLDVDYLVVRDLAVRADLTIDPGVTVRFAGGVSLDIGVINGDGRLTAGELGREIVSFIGEESTPGHWQGIRLRNTQDSNFLRNVRVEHAGAGPWTGNATSVAALFVVDSAVELTDVTFANNTGETDVLVDVETSTVTGCTGVIGTFRGDEDATFCNQ